MHATPVPRVFDTLYIVYMSYVAAEIASRYSISTRFTESNGIYISTGRRGKQERSSGSTATTSTPTPALSSHQFCPHRWNVVAFIRQRIEWQVCVQHFIFGSKSKSHLFQPFLIKHTFGATVKSIKHPNLVSSHSKLHFCIRILLLLNGIWIKILMNKNVLLILTKKNVCDNGNGTMWVKPVLHQWGTFQ